MVLRNCPFCGGKASLHANYSCKTDTWYIFGKCQTCDAQGKAFPGEDPEPAGWTTAACIDAAELWNKRYTEPENPCEHCGWRCDD